MKRTSKEFWNWYHEEKWNVPIREREEWENRAYKEWLDEMEEGDHCHIAFYSDVEPCTIVKRTKSTITVRMDKATRNFTPEWVPGGFSAVCVNNDDQDWIIEEDPDGRTEVFRKHKDGRWHGYGCKLYPEWMKKYDYNF